jgi:2-methylaconitate cis-trans-isomerase PrpF
MDARLLLQSGRLVSNTQIPGVHGTFPGVDLFLRNPVGSKTGTLFPTGHPADRIGDVDVTCIDVAVPMVIVKASAFGKSGHESPKELDADPHFKEALRALWVEAGLRMGLRKRDGTLMSAHDIAHSETIPKVCLVSPADSGGHIKARYFTPQSAHPSLAVSGGCCLASACLIPGTVAHAVATATASAPPLEPSLKEFNIAVENPAGLLDTVIEACHADDTIHIAAAAYRRSAQILLKGLVPLYHCSDALFSALSKKAHH